MGREAVEINLTNLSQKLHGLEVNIMIKLYSFSLNVIGQQLLVMVFAGLNGYVQHHTLQILHTRHDFPWLAHILYGNTYNP